MKPPDLRERLAVLRGERKQRKRRTAKRPRSTLTAAERREVLAKTAGCCHICGGKIGDAVWQADHIIAHSAGGDHRVDNYLPAHAICNNYRWDYLPDEFQFILKLGVWARTEIEHGTKLGSEVSAAFMAHEARRFRRRKQPKSPQRI